jgi:hypothetical protein
MTPPFRFRTTQQQMLCTVPFVLASEANFIAPWPYVNQPHSVSPTPLQSALVFLFLAAFAWMYVGRVITNPMIDKGMTTFVGVPLTGSPTRADIIMFRVVSALSVIAFVAVSVMLMQLIKPGGFATHLIMSLIGGLLASALVFFNSAAFVWILSGFSICPRSGRFAKAQAVPAPGRPK